jgi:hypothetical protein
MFEASPPTPNYSLYNAYSFGGKEAKALKYGIKEGKS